MIVPERGKYQQASGGVWFQSVLDYKSRLRKLGFSREMGLTQNIRPEGGQY